MARRGRWKKGESGNPSGRPPVDPELKALAKTHTTEAIRTLAEIMHRKSANDHARVAAARELLDRGHGRPEQSITGSLDVTVRDSFAKAIAQAPDIINRFAEERPVYNQ